MQANTNTNNVARKLTKAQIMRDQIALVKSAQSNTTVAQQQQYVIDWMVSTLAFKKQLAKVYVSENWHKVVV